MSDRFRARSAAVLFFLTALVLLLWYLPIMRVHEGWEDEVYWVSTCYSMIRHTGATPSVLQGFSSPQSPLLFYGPLLFWLGAATLKFFGMSMASWRTFVFAGQAASVGAMAVVFWRYFRSSLVAACAAFVSSLSLSGSFSFSLPGRPDSWGVALLLCALAAVTPTPEERRTASTPGLGRYILFGGLLGMAAVTSPRTWPFLCSLLLTMLFFARERRFSGCIATGAAMLTTITIVLLPLHTSPLSFLAYVQRASAGDPRDVSALMGGRWDFAAARSQSLFYGVMLGILAVARWSLLPRFFRWLMVAGVVNLALLLSLVFAPLRSPTYWGFPFEICVMIGLFTPGRMRSRLTAGALGCVLVVYMLALRTARELPVWTHWAARDPAAARDLLRSTVPPGSLVYGPKGSYFYPTLANGSDYLYLRDWTTPGRSSVPGQVDAEAKMTEACHRPAFLSWPLEEAGGPAPPLAHASLERVAEHHVAAEQRSRIERLLERIPGGRADEPTLSFAVYRITMRASYCGAQSTP